jgi:hypothetical protein
MRKRARIVVGILLVAVAAVGGWLFALRTETMLRYFGDGGGGASYYYSADDAVTRIVLVGSAFLFLALVLLYARLERRGEKTRKTCRWVLVAILAVAAFMLTFEGVIEVRNPEKFPVRSDP